MAYTETTSTSWFTRIKNSFAGTLVGIGLVIGGTCLLWWNEGDFVATRDALIEAQKVTEELPDISRVSAEANGKVIHAIGQATTKETLNDPLFNISAPAISLQRSVQYYQWTEQSKTEKTKELGGKEVTTTTYTYSKQWVSRPVDSSAFHDPEARQKNTNHVRLSAENQTFYARNVTFGAYRLPDFFIRAISTDPGFTITLSEQAREALARRLVPQAATNAAAMAGAKELIHASPTGMFIGKDEAQPRIGDMRVKYKAALPAEVSIIAKVAGDTFTRYAASNGKTISRLAMGARGLDEMFADAHSGNSTMTWILRAIGTVMIIAGLQMTVAPLSVLVGVIPFLETIVGGGLGFVCLLLGLAWALVVIAIAWIFYRPLLGIALFAAAAALIALLYMRGRKRKAQAAA
jgi:hypothetical protein